MTSARPDHHTRQPSPDAYTGSGVIEIELAGGHRLRAEAGADLTLLQGVIAALTGR